MQPYLVLVNFTQYSNQNNKKRFLNYQNQRKEKLLNGEKRYKLGNEFKKH